MQPRGRYLAFGLIGAFALIAVAFLLVGGLTITSASGGGPEMALRIKAPAPGSCAGDTCTLDPGQAFTLSVEIVTAPTAGYIGVQSFIVFGSDLVYKPAEPASEILWPDLESATGLSTCSQSPPCTASGPAGQASHGGLTGLLSFTTSTFTGNYLDLSFNCSASPSQTVVELLPLGDPLASTFGSGFSLPPTGDDQEAAKVNSLTINCGAGTAETETPTPTTDGPTATSTLTGTPGPATDTPVAPTATNTPPPPPPTATPSDALLGDVDCDGVVSSLDALLLLQLVAQLVDELSCPDVADVNEDGMVDAVDALWILWIEAGLI